MQDTVAGRDGTDSLVNVELLEFFDQIKLNRRDVNLNNAFLTGGKALVGTELDASGVGDQVTIGGTSFGIRTINLLGGGTDSVTLAQTGAYFLSLLNVESLTVGGSGIHTLNLQNNVSNLAINLGDAIDQLNLATGANSVGLSNVENVFVNGSGNLLTLLNEVSNVGINFGAPGTNTLQLAAGVNHFTGVNGVTTILGSGSDDTLTIDNGLFNSGVDLGAGTNDTLNINVQSSNFGVLGVENVNGSDNVDNNFTLINKVTGVTFDLGTAATSFGDHLNLANGVNSLGAIDVEQINGSDFVTPSPNDDLTLLNNVTNNMVVNLGLGTNTLRLNGGINTLGGVFGTTTIIGTAGLDTLTLTGSNGLFNATVDLGGDSGDSLTIHAANAQFGVAGVETINGNGDSNFFNLTSNVSGITVNLGGGISDGLALANGVNSLTAIDIEQIGSSDFSGPASDDELTLLDTVNGLTVNLNAGTNTLTLAEGANTLATIVGVATVNGSTGADTLTLTNGLFNTTVDLGDDVDTLNLADTGNNVTVENVENVFGGIGGDMVTIANTSGTTTVTGGGGNDTVNASAGTDIIRLAAAADSFATAADLVANFDADFDSFEFDSSGVGFIGVTGFDFIGAAGFTNQGAGTVRQIRLDESGFQPQLQIDIDGNGLFDPTDAAINLQSHTGVFDNANFLLS